MNPKQHGFRSGRSSLSQLLEHHNKILEELEKSDNVDVIYLDFVKAFDTVESELIVKSVCEYTFFYQTDNVLPSTEQQMKLKSEVSYPKGQC